MREYPSIDHSAEVYITAELHKRPAKRVDLWQEKLALHELTRRMLEAPDEVLPRLVDIAMEMTGSVSGGISLYEPCPAPGVFRWHYLRGALAAFNGATTPRDYSPCGVCLDQRETILVERPERVYSWLVEADVAVPECLLVPLYVGDTPFGTLWIVSETEEHFDTGDARALSELSAFTSMALKMVESRQELQQALAQQEILARELNHRVKNVFALTEGMIRYTSRSADTPKAMASLLSGRLQALAHAHELVHRRFQETLESEQSVNMEQLIRALLKPHDDPTEQSEAEGSKRIRVAGPRFELSDRATSSLALIFHELATNAAKYGSLSVAEGMVDISWREDGDTAVFRWEECHGPIIEREPEGHGFGSTMSRQMVQQLRGTIDYDWQPEGLVATITIPTASLAVPAVVAEPPSRPTA